MRKFLSLQLSIYLLSGFFAPMALASNINLYDQPQSAAKVIGTIDSSATMVPIFSDKSGTWMKVGDPKNGNVGWIKIGDVANAKNGSNATGFSMTEQTVDTKNGPTTYRTIQFGNGQPANTDSAQAIIQRIQAQQNQIQQQTQKAVNDLYRDMAVLYHTNPNAFNNPGIPMFMPVIIVPQPANSVAPAPAAKAVVPPASKQSISTKTPPPK